MAQGEESKCFEFVMLAIAIGLMAGFVYFLVSESMKSCDTNYMVTITSVDGLDLHGDRQALSPVFGITVHINNTRNQIMEECVGGVGSSAIVSYGNAMLAKGTMPGLCVKKTKVGEAASKAWGMNVQVPHFLRDRLAGELERGQAVVDVVVRTPGGGGCYINGCLDSVLVCKAKIGGGPSPCYRATTVSGTTTNT